MSELLGMEAHTPVMPAFREAEAGKSNWERCLGNLARPCLKIVFGRLRLQLSGEVPMNLIPKNGKKNKNTKLWVVDKEAANTSAKSEVIFSNPVRIVGKL